MTLEAVLERHLNHGESTVPVSEGEWAGLQNLLAFRGRVRAAHDKSREQSRHPFFAGQRLRRLIRELLEERP